MTDKDYQRLIELTPCGGGFMAANDNAQMLLDSASPGEVITFQEMTNRDVKFHRAYFSLISFIWDWLPASFKKKIPKDKFYTFLKHLRKEYDVVFTFADGSQIVEYQSIAFGNMSQQRFKEYVKSQLPYIYSEVVMVLFPDKSKSDAVIQSIEEEYKIFLSKL
jgi:hypothetical protein